MKSFRGSPLVLFAMVVVLGSLNFALQPVPARRNFEILPEMVRSVAAESFSANPEFPDGKALQAPPPGTILRGETPLHFAASPADATRAGAELVNPVVTSPATLARGELVFATFCFPCHGTEGRGDGAVAQRGFPTPPSLLADKARVMKDGQLFHIITYGGENMPSYARQIDSMDRWSAILWVRELQKRLPVSRPDGPGEPVAPVPVAGIEANR